MKFGTISSTYKNPPFSKPWAIAQAFCSKSAHFGSFGIHSKSSCTSLKVVLNTFASILEAFQEVWNDFQHLTKSTIFKTMGYSPGFLLEIGRFRTIRNSLQIFITSLKVVGNAFGSPLEAFQEVSNDFQHLTKSPIFKAMGYSPGFVLKIGRFRTIRNSLQIFLYEPESSFKYICKHIAGVSGSLERFPALNQIRHFQNFLLEIGRFSGVSELTPNLHQKVQK